MIKYTTVLILDGRDFLLKAVHLIWLLKIFVTSSNLGLIEIGKFWLSVRVKQGSNKSLGSLGPSGKMNEICQILRAARQEFASRPRVLFKISQNLCSIFR